MQCFAHMELVVYEPASTLYPDMAKLIMNLSYPKQLAIVIDFVPWRGI